MKHEGIGGKYLNRVRTTMTGRETEEGLLGGVDKANKKYRLFLLRRGIPEGLLRNMHEAELPYISFHDAMDLVKFAQPWKDPTNPEKDFLRDLRIEVADRLGIGSNEDALDCLRIYTAVGSPLDLLHGVDAFLEYEKKNGAVFRVLLDITNDPAHKKGKPGVLVVDAGTIGDAAGDGKDYLDSLGGLAAEIERKFRMFEARSN